MSEVYYLNLLINKILLVFFKERNGAPTPEELPMNVIECIKTIGELRDLLQKETQTRMVSNN
jgi:hypothetical protein